MYRANNPRRVFAPIAHSRSVDFSLRMLHTQFPEDGWSPRRPTAPPPVQTTSSRYLAHRATCCRHASITAGRYSRKSIGSTPQIFLRIPLPVATQLIISNRRACRLEMPESYRKQRTATHSNRHKCSVSFSTSSPPRSPLRRSAGVPQTALLDRRLTHVRLAPGC